MSKVVLIFLFLINAFFYLYRADVPELRGDETVPYISLLPFFHFLAQGKFVPTFLAFYHEPLQLVIQLPVLIFGAFEFWVRLPNIIAGILTFVVLYKIGRLLWREWKFTYVLLSLYTFSGFFLLNRLAIDIGVFNLVVTLIAYLLLRKKSQPSLIVWLLANFIFLDALFLLPGIIASKVTKFKVIAKYFGIFVILVIGWFSVVYLASVISGVFDWKAVAPYRIFRRGGSFSLLSPISNWEALLQYNHPTYVLLIIFLSIISIFVHKIRKIWFLLAPPMLFFLFVKTPTVHLLSFFPLIFILATGGASFLFKRTVTRCLIGASLIICLVFNFRFVLVQINSLKIDGYKAMRTFVETNILPCDKGYTNLDGYAFRMYFNRSYTKNLEDDFSFAIITGEAPQELITKANFIFRLDTLQNPKKYDPKYFKPNNIMTYITNCKQ